MKAHLLRATLSVKFLEMVREPVAREAATRHLAVLAMKDIIVSNSASSTTIRESEWSVKLHQRYSVIFVHYRIVQLRVAPVPHTLSDLLSSYITINWEWNVGGGVSVEETNGTDEQLFI